jgi:hypothetical protein
LVLSPSPTASIQSLPKFQEVVHSERRAALGNTREGIDRHHIGDGSVKGLQYAVRSIEEDSIFSPVVASMH